MLTLGSSGPKMAQLRGEYVGHFSAVYVVYTMQYLNSQMGSSTYCIKVKLLLGMAL